MEVYLVNKLKYHSQATNEEKDRDLVFSAEDTEDDLEDKHRIIQARIRWVFSAEDTEDDLEDKHRIIQARIRWVFSAEDTEDDMEDKHRIIQARSLQC